MKGVDAMIRSTKHIAALRNTFDDYMKQGGFPELLQVKNRKRYMTNLIQNILQRDIEQRYKISFPAQFENMAHHLLNTSPCVLSNKELVELFDFKSPHTVQNYVKYLKEAYVLIGVKKYSPKSKLRTVGEKGLRR